MAKAKSKKTTTKTTTSVKDMVNTMLEIVESQGDLKASVTFTKRDITKSIPVDRENITTLQGLPKTTLQETYNSLIDIKKKSSS